MLLCFPGFVLAFAMVLFATPVPQSLSDESAFTALPDAPIVTTNPLASSKIECTPDATTDHSDALLDASNALTNEISSDDARKRNLAKGLKMCPSSSPSLSHPTANHNSEHSEHNGKMQNLQFFNRHPLGGWHQRSTSDPEKPCKIMGFPVHVTCGGPEVFRKAFNFVRNCVRGSTPSLPAQGRYRATKKVSEFCCGTLFEEDGEYYGSPCIKRKGFPELDHWNYLFYTQWVDFGLSYPVELEPNPEFVPRI